MKKVLLAITVSLYLAAALCLSCAQQPIVIAPRSAITDQPASVMPDKYCYKTEEGTDENGNSIPSYYIFLGNDGDLGLSTVSCTAAAIDWQHRFIVYPKRYKI